MNNALYELFHRCTVRLVNTNSHTNPRFHEQGTGFFVAPGLILTCAHVVDQAQESPQILEVLWEGQTRQAQKIDCFKEGDLALVWADSLTGHPCVLFDPTIAPFDSLYSYGYPASHSEGDSATFDSEGWTRVGGETLLKFKAGQVEPGI